MNNSPFPLWDEEKNVLVDGTLFKTPTICKKANIEKCKKYYNSIKGVQGFYQCPKGFSSYCTGGTERQIYSGLRILKHYDIKALKRYSDTYLPTLPGNIVIEAITKLNCLRSKNSKSHDIELMNSSLHEIRKFNREIKSYSEEIMNGGEKTNGDLQKKAKTIFAASSLISVRLNIFDFDENPQIVTSSSPYPINIFRKFEKSAHILEIYAKKKYVNIKPFIGSSYKTIDGYPVLEFLSFVILENAVKYSPSNQDITVKFDEYKSGLDVTISSVGPLLTKQELSEVFEKGTRAKAAKQADESGGGYGLYFAKLICDLHGINITASTSLPRFQLNGVQYADFTIKIQIP